ncbi:ABC transporter permease [Photobacterium leiognathi]|uniref:ABC transporter permease n=1 Tax=Photobacterium leiognathi TaxID=553611 RepID=UPI0029811771|nr:ABC transporter permease [Photobacterium leiognathi]
MSESVNSTLDIQWIAMAGFYLLLLIPIFLFQRWQLGLNRTLINSVLRMTLQLSVVGIYLHTLFGLQSIVINIVWLSIMALVASYTICKRAEVNLKRVLPAVIVGQFTALIVALPVMLIGVIQVEPWWQAQYMIPIAGMLLGNSLMANVLALSRWGSLLKENHSEYQYYLSLGAPDPALPFIQTAVKSALTPQLAAMTTLGIVSLPGMMTGQILGGAAPLVAVKYQLVIMVAIFISGVISVATTLSIVRRVTFNAYGEVR